jgi:phenylpropionate dioxygenase-like ring-hydroxylating dioxygenase large terminal subunit
VSALKPTQPDDRAIAAARRVLRDSGHVADPFATAEIFPAEAYVGDDFWRFERWALFEKEWLCIGHANQVPKPADHFTITVLDEPLIITRDERGEVHVLSAICQHRGHPLMDGLDAPDEPGRCRNGRLLLCPYHAWSYRLDGSLQAAPEMDRTASIDELRRTVRLPRVRHEIFHGLIFINFDADAPALAPSLSRLEPIISAFRMGELMAAPSSSLAARSNWKIYQENSLEPYHTDVVHKASHNPAPANLSAFYAYEPGDGAIITTTGFNEGTELFAADGAQQLPEIPGVSAEERERVLFVAILPTLFLVMEAGQVLVNLVFPLGPETMTRVMFSLYPAEAIAAPQFSDVARSHIEALEGIVAEDWATQEALQRGHASRFTPKGRLSWLETTIPQMNHWLVERYRARLDDLDSKPPLASLSMQGLLLTS